MICIVCGGPSIRMRGHHGWRLTCSPECLVVRRRQVTASHWSEGRISAATLCDRDCQSCGVPMRSVPLPQTLCADCARTRPERARERARLWYAANPDWYERRRARRREAHRRYYAANRDKILASQRAYYLRRKAEKGLLSS